MSSDEETVFQNTKRCHTALLCFREEFVLQPYCADGLNRPLAVTQQWRCHPRRSGDIEHNACARACTVRQAYLAPVLNSS